MAVFRYSLFVAILAIATVSADTSGTESRCICCDARLKKVTAPGKCAYFGFNEVYRGRCVPIIPNVSCTSNSQCPFNYVCVGGECVSEDLLGANPADCDAVYGSCISRCTFPEGPCGISCRDQRLQCHCAQQLLQCLMVDCPVFSGEAYENCIDHCFATDAVCLLG